MKNGTRSNGRSSVVERPGDTPDEKLFEYSALEYPQESAQQSTQRDPRDSTKDLLENRALFAVVSIACFAAALAAGSYAVWLSRRKVANQALTHVSDLLETCQSRMLQIERDMSSLASPTQTA